MPWRHAIPSGGSDRSDATKGTHSFERLCPDGFPHVKQDDTPNGMPALTCHMAPLTGTNRTKRDCPTKTKEWVADR